MTDLEWSATLRYGPYLRATLSAAAAAFVPLAVLLGVVVGLQLADDLGTGGTVVVALVAACVVMVIVAAAVANQLRGVIRATGSRVQRYVLGVEALVITLGRDSASVPLSELVVGHVGRDHVVVRRRTSRRRRAVLFFDSPDLVPVVAQRLRAGSSATPRP